MRASLRRLPAIHRLLAADRLAEAAARHGHELVREACRAELAEIRARIEAGDEDVLPLGDASAAVTDRVLRRLEAETREAYRRVINAAGVLLHTNLGRAPLPAAQPASLAGYLTLEYDLAAGRRGQRLAPLKERIARVCGAEAAVMVNNNAAALMLLLATHARGRSVLVSRSQLIEIGGSFRLPDVMAAAGARLVEVGCTNRTHLRDYERGIDDDTAAILVAHQSNFRIVGFTTAPDHRELAELAHRHGLPLWVDQGSGCLHDLRRWGLPHEDTVAELLEAGADVVCFSGDKLLGGPQAGLLVGTREAVEPLGRHPMYRALRPDKTALVLMDRVLAAHTAGRLEEIPLYALMARTPEELRRRAARLRRRLAARGVPATSRATRSAVGGGTTPDETMASWGLGVPGGQALADALRRTEPPVIARLEDDEVVLDLRTVRFAEERELVEAVAAAYTGLSARTASGR